MVYAGMITEASEMGPVTIWVRVRPFTRPISTDFYECKFLCTKSPETVR